MVFPLSFLLANKHRPWVSFRVLYNSGMLLLEVLNSTVSLLNSPETIASLVQLRLKFLFDWLSLLFGNVLLYINRFS